MMTLTEGIAANDCLRSNDVYKASILHTQYDAQPSNGLSVPRFSSTRDATESFLTCLASLHKAIFLVPILWLLLNAHRSSNHGLITASTPLRQIQEHFLLNNAQPCSRFVQQPPLAL